MRRFHFLLLLLLTTTTVLAQRFTSKVEEVNGYYRLTFTVTSRDVSDFTPPRSPISIY